MKKMIFVMLLIAAILAITLFGNRANQDTGLAKKIDSLFENGEIQIDLMQATDFDWTQVSIFGPYTSNKVIEDSMGIKFKGNNGGIDLLDDRMLLVFANEKYAVKTVVLSMKHGPYSIEDNTFLSVGHDKFKYSVQHL